MRIPAFVVYPSVVLGILASLPRRAVDAQAVESVASHRLLRAERPLGFAEAHRGTERSAADPGDGWSSGRHFGDLASGAA